MNQEPNIPTEKIDLMDALLSEHARLGTGEDTALVDAILLKTVDLPADLPQPVAKASFGWQDWAKVAAVVTVFFGIMVAILGEIPGLNNREETTFQLTVTYAPTPDETPDPPVVSDETPAPQPRNGVVRDVHTVVAATEMAPVLPVVKITLVETSSPTLAGEFAPSIDLFNAATAGRVESFTVSANRVNRTAESLEYNGAVEIKHAEFHIRAEHLVVQAGPVVMASVAPRGAFQAYGAVIERTLENGDIEIAKAEKLVYRPENQSLVLTGQKMELKAGTKTQHFDEDDGKLILRPNGYQVVRK